jgi:hypothetical protein
MPIQMDPLMEGKSGAGAYILKQVGAPTMPSAVI